MKRVRTADSIILVVAVRLELPGKVRLLRDGVESQWGHQALLCLFALRAPELAKRAELIESLFRDQPRSEALSRSRVGLSLIRNPVPMVETSGQVQIDLERVGA